MSSLCSLIQHHITEPKPVTVVEGMALETPEAATPTTETVSESVVDNPEETMRITVVWQLVMWLHVVVVVHNHNHLRLQLLHPFEAQQFNKIMQLDNFCKMWEHTFVSYSSYISHHIVVAVRRVCLNSWWSYGGFSRQV